MTFDLDLIITINLRNEFLRSELYGEVVLEIYVRLVVLVPIANNANYVNYGK